MGMGDRIDQLSVSGSYASTRVQTVAGNIEVSSTNGEEKPAAGCVGGRHRAECCPGRWQRSARDPLISSRIIGLDFVHPRRLLSTDAGISTDHIDLSRNSQRGPRLGTWRGDWRKRGPGIFPGIISAISGCQLSAFCRTGDDIDASIGAFHSRGEDGSSLQGRTKPPALMSHRCVTERCIRIRPHLGFQSAPTMQPKQYPNHLRVQPE